MNIDDIATLVAALDVDYARLEKLWRLGDARTATEHREYVLMLQDAGGCKNYEEAKMRVCETAQMVEVRSDWTPPYDALTPHEYIITLSKTARITGQLDDNARPVTATLEVDGARCQNALQSVLLAYANCLYYGV